MYVDSSCSLNENLIQIRFSDYKSCIYFVQLSHVNFKLPTIIEKPEVLTILILDNIKLLKHELCLNYDIQVILIADDG